MKKQTNTENKLVVASREVGKGIGEIKGIGTNFPL